MCNNNIYKADLLKLSSTGPLQPNIFILSAKFVWLSAKFLALDIKIANKSDSTVTKRLMEEEPSL